MGAGELEDSERTPWHHGWRSPKQLRQPRDVDGDRPRLVFRQHLGLQRFGFAFSGVDVGDRLTVGVTDDIAAGDLFGAPGRREAARRHGFHPPARYGFHLTGMTASGVPLLELTQPDAVSLQWYGSLSPLANTRTTASSTQ
jgi:hypothetical protein